MITVLISLVFLLYLVATASEIYWEHKATKVTLGGLAISGVLALICIA